MTRLVPLALLAGCFACSATAGAPGTGDPDLGGAGGQLGVDPGVITGAAGNGSAPGDDSGCKNVDLLFVVDNSASMADQQKSLIASFPGFVSGIKTRLANAQSYHVGVVTTDDYYVNQPGCTKIGSLVTRTGGIGSTNTDCSPFATGGRYLDGNEPDLLSKFACVAQVGIAGNDDERVARALLDATKPANNAVGACNAGFSRPDSLLVVTIVTDEDDVPDVCDGQGSCVSYGSGGTPQQWHDELVANKGGIADNVVVLSLLGRKLDNSCGAMVASKLIGFTNRFGKNGYLGDVCAPSYDGFFEEALPVIETACQNYQPPH